MPTWIFAAWLLWLTLCTALSTVGVIHLWRLQRRAPRDARISTLEREVDDLSGRLRRLNGRVGRYKQLDEGEEAEKPANDTAQRVGETAAEWKARMRLNLAAGRK